MSTICNICPRNCNVDRSINTGYCKEGNEIKVARASLHKWEEPCISHTNGSGTIFFSGCNMRCVYCQNYPISQGKVGKIISVEKLADIFFNLKSQGAHNINMVTPTHFTTQIKQALDIAKSKGMDLPVVWNTSGYETVSTIKSLKDYVDIYLTDFKYMSEETSKKYSNCPDYPMVAKKALSEMVSQTGSPQLDENGVMKKGVIVRHLLLPGFLEESKQVLKYLKTEFGEKIIISIMSQFTPTDNLKNYPEINRKVTKYEYDKLVEYAESIGIEKAYIQQGSAASESFIPDFDCSGI